MKELIIQAVLFDFDGTLTRPGSLNFGEIRSAIGCPPHGNILEYVQSLVSEEERERANRILEEFEEKASAESYPNDGALELLEFLQEKQIPYGILTRNSRKSIERSFRNFPDGMIDSFAVVISRDDKVEAKPSADGLIMAARYMNVRPEDLLMVGDYVFDIEAGKNASAATAFLEAPEDIMDDRRRPAVLRAREMASFVCTSLRELKEFIKWHIALEIGKVPNEDLGQLLKTILREDPRLIIRSRVGEDITAVETTKKVMVLKSDPITFATSKIGEYALVINANDIVTSGALPRWFLSTVIMPPGTSLSQIEGVYGELKEAADRLDITVCGGHTEISDAVTRPVVSGFLVAEIERDTLIDKRNIQEADKILMSKTAGTEGTAVIAGDFRDKLLESGLSQKDIEAAEAFLDRISVLREARIAASVGDVHGLHDVTEGGVATALEEFSIAAARVFHIDLGRIPISPLTERIAAAFDINPLGLIGSGSLLLCCNPEKAGPIIEACRTEEIELTEIGFVGEEGSGIKAREGGRESEWPSFERDEIARLYG